MNDQWGPDLTPELSQIGPVITKSRYTILGYARASGVAHSHHSMVLPDTSRAETGV